MTEKDNVFVSFQEEKWYSAQLKQEVDKVTAERDQLEEVSLYKD